MNKNINIKFNVLAIISIIIFCFAITPVTFQNDTYYTISIGKHILETGQIDMQDPFSWHENLPYTYPHWLYDVGTYAVYNIGETLGIGGFCAVYIATILLCITLGLIIYGVCNKLSKNQVVSLILTIGIMYLLEDFIAARAQLVSYILLALTILFIELFLQTKKKRYPIYLIIISTLMANLHCAVWPFYFIVYMPYIVEYIIAAISDSNFIYKFQIKFNEYRLKKLKIKQSTETTNEKLNNQIEEISKKIQELKNQQHLALLKDEQRRKNPYKIILKKNPAAKWLILILVICIFTGLLTPLGTTPYTYLIKTMDGNTTQNISEHQPLTLYNNKPMLIVFAAFFALLIFTDTKLTLRDFFMFAGLILLSFMSRRQTAIFLILCGFIFAKLIATFLQKYDKKGTENLIEFMTTFLGKTLSILIVILISFLIFRNKIDDKFVSKSSYPIEASNYILENLDLENIKLFNEYNYGSYLLFRGIPVFIDSRADLYAPEFNGVKGQDGKYEGRDIFSDYINVSSISTYYEDKFEHYGITHVITKDNTKLNMFLSRDTNYIQMYSDDDFVIYKRLVQDN